MGLTLFVREVVEEIVTCGDNESRFKVRDTCSALKHRILAVTSEGLGSSWIGSFDEEELREMLEIPGGSVFSSSSRSASLWRRGI